MDSTVGDHVAAQLQQHRRDHRTRQHLAQHRHRRRLRRELGPIVRHGVEPLGEPRQQLALLAVHVLAELADRLRLSARQHRRRRAVRARRVLRHPLKRRQRPQRNLKNARGDGARVGVSAAGREPDASRPISALAGVLARRWPRALTPGGGPRSPWWRRRAPRGCTTSA
eukprot:2777355-Prymnesium_polylepis.1